ncbi:MAG TPA: hypothetical protein VGW12_18975 [Pyrinomonadaceae bacterium]|nr:hypothetical protein [Pyrinomonadaceae bacterium]
MKVFSLICSLFFILNQNIPSAAARSIAPPSQTRQEAERLWELAIDAKGGRGRLHSVGNILVAIQTRHYQNIELSVFPDKFWRLSNSPEPLGRSALMFNLERGFGFTADENRPGGGAVRLHQSNLGGGAVVLEEAQIFYLLETRWLKPSVVGVSEERVGGRRVDVVRVMAGDRPVDYYLDRKTHLPLKVALISKQSGAVYFYRTFSDYAPVDGIQMPRTVNVDGDGRLPISFRFNVDYDQQLFERPPSAAESADAWKAKPSS